MVLVTHCLLELSSFVKLIKPADEEMCTPYRRRELCHSSQPHDSEMVSPTSSHGIYFPHNIDGNAGGFHSSQSQDEHMYAKEFSVGADRISSLHLGPWNSACSFDLLSNNTLPEHGFDVGFAGLDGDINSFLRLSGSADLALPPTNRSILLQDPIKDWDCLLSAGSLPRDLHIPLSTSNLQPYATSNQPSMTNSTDSLGCGIFNEWNGGFLASDYGPFLLEYEGSVIKPTDNNDRHIPLAPLTVASPALSPLMPMFYRSSDTPWSHIGTPSSFADERFQNGPGWGLELQGHTADVPFHFSPDNATLGNTFQTSCNPLPAIVDFKDATLEPSVLIPEQTRKRPYCVIAPMPDSSSPDFTRVVESNVVATYSAQNIRGRQGPLNATQREGALKVRKMRACASCRVKKIRCSGGDICDPCQQNHARRTFQWAGCLRKHMEQYADVLCPPSLFQHLGRVAIRRWMKESDLVHTDNKVLLQVSSVNQDFLLLPDLASSKDKDQNFATVPSLQYALHDCEIDNVKPKCLEYISSISKCPLGDPEAVIGDTPKIIWRSLEAIQCFIRANETARRDGLLQKALKVYWIQYSMSRTLTFSSDSATTAIERLKNSSTVSPSQSYISARVLNRQLKGALKLLYEELLGDLLRGLESEYKNKTRRSWVLCFCLNLILCLIVGQLQIAIDGLIIYKKGEDRVRTSKKGVKDSRQLEDLPVKYSYTMFFGIYKTYNPIKNGCLPDDNSGQNQGEADLVNTFREIMRDKEDDILELAATPSSAGSSQNTADHQHFRAHNAAKHLSIFLKNFY